MKFLNISKALRSKRGEIGTIVILVGMAVIGLGILAGSQVRDGRINFLPRASTDQAQAASIWNNVKPAPGNIYPWSNGGPTAGWESYIANFGYFCNGKYCWVLNRNTLSWNNNGSPIVLDQDAGYNTVKPAESGVLPWSNNGPTAAWTWKVTLNGQQLTETLLCNGNYCWRYLRYPDGSATASGWRDGGSPIYLPTYNDLWKDSRVSQLWSGNGLTVAWTDPINSRATLCNHGYCWSLDTQTFQWRMQVAPFPQGVTEFTSAWTSPATNIISLCNKNVCWLFDIAAAKYASAPIILTQTPPTNTPIPVRTNTPIPARTNTPVPIRTSTPKPTITTSTATKTPTPRPANPSTELWNSVQPIAVSGLNIYPWSNGGPTAGWESYIGNMGYICNGKYCWVLDRSKLAWTNGGSPIDLSTNANYKVNAAANGKFPWSDNGPTAAWTWEVTVNGQIANENLLCNGNYCWRYLRYPDGVAGSGWRDGGNPIYLPTHAAVWKDSRVAQLWTGNGITVAWTDNVNKRATLCNHGYCWSMDTKTFQWRMQVSPFPQGVTEFTSAWTSPATNIISLCNKNVCWQFDINAAGYAASSITLTSTKVNSPTPIRTSTPKPINSPTARPPYPSTELWNSVKPIVVSGVNIYPWSNGGPTAGWESYIGNMAYICNGNYCWTLDRNKLAWTNGGKPFNVQTEYSTLEESTSTTPQAGVSLWSGNGPTAAWTWIVPYNGYTVNEAVICNGNYCWRYLRYPDGVAGSGWRDGGSPIYLPTYTNVNNVWKDSRVAPLWTGNGITVAWTDPINSRVTLCNHNDCRSLDYKNWQWRFDGAKIQPYPPNSGITEYTSAWTSPVTNIISLCYKNVCWQYDIPAGTYASSPVTLISTKATPTIATVTSKPNAKPAITSYTWKPQVPVIGNTVTATITGTDADSSQVSIEVHVYGQGYPDTVFVKGNAVVSGGKWTFKVTQTIPGFTGKFTTYVIMNDGVNSVKSGNYEVSVVAPTPKDTCLRKREGDANCDGNVNLLDITCLGREMAGVKPQNCVSGDFSNNGKAWIEDAAIWRSTFIRENVVK